MTIFRNGSFELERFGSTFNGRCTHTYKSFACQFKSQAVTTFEEEQHHPPWKIFSTKNSIKIKKNEISCFAFGHKTVVTLGLNSSSSDIKISYLQVFKVMHNINIMLVYVALSLSITTLLVSSFTQLNTNTFGDYWKILTFEDREVCQQIAVPCYVGPV